MLGDSRGVLPRRYGSTRRIAARPALSFIESRKASPMRSQPPPLGGYRYYASVLGCRCAHWRAGWADAGIYGGFADDIRLSLVKGDSFQVESYFTAYALLPCCRRR